MKALKLLNPIIWLWNMFKYSSHLDEYRHAEYQPYDFDKYDTKYF